MNQRLSTHVLYCRQNHVSVSVKDSLDSQLEEAKLFTVKRTYVILNWVDRRTAFTRQRVIASIQTSTHQPLNLPAVPGSHVLLQD